MKGNIHKRVTYEDKFARKNYCDNARLRQLRFEKKMQKKAFRRWRKKEAFDDPNYRGH